MSKDTVPFGLAPDTAERWREYRASGRITHDMLSDPGFRDQLSLFSGLACDPEEDKTRQEHRAETEISYLLARHGVMPLPVQYGEQDFRDDLHDLHIAARDVAERYSALSPELRAKYADIPSIVQAIADGKLVVEDGILKAAPVAAAPSAGAAGAASASDSAPVQGA